MMTTVITWKYFSFDWLAGKSLDRCSGWDEVVTTDKINYATLDLASVVPFSTGFIRILIRFRSSTFSCRWRFGFVQAFNEKRIFTTRLPLFIFFSSNSSEFKVRIRVECGETRRRRKKGFAFFDRTLSRDARHFNLIWNLYHALVFWHQTF